MFKNFSFFSQDKKSLPLQRKDDVFIHLFAGVFYLRNIECCWIRLTLHLEECVEMISTSVDGGCRRKVDVRSKRQTVSAKHFN